MYYYDQFIVNFNNNLCIYYYSHVIIALLSNLNIEIKFPITFVGRTLILILFNGLVGGIISA